MTEESESSEPQDDAARQAGEGDAGMVAPESSGSGPAQPSPDSHGEGFFLWRSIRAWPKWLRRSLLLLVAAVLLILLTGVAVILYANFTAVWSARGLIHDQVEDVTKCKVALVFGTTDRIKGRENLYYRYRIDAAEALWKAGKIDTLIVSGDNRTPWYNEPKKMRRSLIERGIPSDRIVCDFAGLRTLDSVVRAKKIFGADEVLFISQRFHLQRAIYLAKAHGLKAHGFAAQDVKGKAGTKTRLREIGARVKMWLDVNFLNTEPRHLGDKEPMPE